MTANLRGAEAAILAAFDFSRFGRIADLGGGHGAFLAAILRANPKAHGVVFDQAHVVSGAGAVLRAAGVEERCQVVAGDVFASVPAGADAYMLCGMLCDYDDSIALALLRVCRRAMSGTSRLLVVDRFVEAPNEGLPAKLFDLDVRDDWLPGADARGVRRALRARRVPSGRSHSHRQPALRDRSGAGLRWRADAGLRAAGRRRP